MVKTIKLVISVGLLLALDQWVKFWTVSHLQLGEIKPFIKGVVSLTYLQNSGAAFSILQHQQWFFTLVSLVVLGAALYYYFKRDTGLWLKELALIFIIAGGLGNFSDRLRLGYVIDMVHLDFIDFAIFNVADSYLCIGVALLFIVLWKEEV
ncbi:signal peptidase II [Streptococcus halichoeri]|uniref:signal peptidase II n=1 Tax=Streptococcus halichoeri TaxID=254785 RepID=UPI00135AD13D|nr:signal peptidase II [Streptococcus halichoeri]